MGTFRVTTSNPAQPFLFLAISETDQESELNQPSDQTLKEKQRRVNLI